MAQTRPVVLLAVIAVLSLWLTAIEHSIFASCESAIDILEEKQTRFVLSRPEKKRLAAAYLELLSKKAGQMTRDQVRGVMDKLEAYEDLLGDFVRGDPNSWAHLLRVRPLSLQCDGDFTTFAPKFALAHKHNEPQYDYVLGYLGEYLERCGHEDQFKKVVANIKAGGHQHYYANSHSSVESYFLAEFWPQMMEIYGQKSYKALSWLLSIIGQLSKFEGTGNSPRCKDKKEWARLLLWLEDSKIDYPHLNNLLKDHFALALDKCGIEGRVRKLRKQADSNDSPLADQLLSKLAVENLDDKEVNLDRVLTTLETLSNMVDADRILEPGFAGVPQSRTADNYRDLSWTLDTESLADVAKANDFKVIASQPKTKESLAFVEKVSNLIEFEFMPHFKTFPSRAIAEGSLQVANKGLAIVSKYGLKPESLLSDLGEHCQVLRGEVWPKMCTMEYDFATASKDEQIMHLMNYLSYCSFEPKDDKSDQQTCSAAYNRLFAEMGAPYYPTEGSTFKQVKFQGSKQV